jgi:pimeloyl-ACP methyl ester carboxylesterase
MESDELAIRSPMVSGLWPAMPTRCPWWRAEAIVRSRLLSNSPLVVAILFAAFVATRAISATPASTPEDGMTPYLTPQRVVPIEKGRTINLVCLGQGSPTVILTAGLGGWSYAWGNVQPAIAERTRVCAWDPAGTGFSSPSPEPQDIVHITQDLERALKSASVEGPYVVVGHSLGGFVSLRFADLHPRSVVGMVLVDPDIPDRAAVVERLAPQLATVFRVFQDQAVKPRQDCAAQLRRNALKSGTPQFERCTAPSVPDFFPRLKATMAGLNADPARLLTQASIEEEHDNSARQVINAQRRYGDMPLIVLTAGQDESTILNALPYLPPGTPGTRTPAEQAQLREQIARFLRDGWGAAHESYAALSTRGRHQVVQDSSHNIPGHKPAVVISAVIEVLNKSP